MFLIPFLLKQVMLHTLHDLLLEIRFAERDQNTDLVFLSGQVEGPSKRIRLEIQLLHNRPNLFFGLRSDLTTIVEHAVYCAA